MTSGPGVLAFGDSITNGWGELQWGIVSTQSWALWIARGLGLSYSPHAFDGAFSYEVLSVQIPRFLKTASDPEARYALGCLYVGTNDVRAPDWDPEVFTARVTEAAEFLASRCDRILMPTLPLDLGRPKVVAQIEAANAVTHQVAGTVGALVIELRDFSGRELMLPDRVHPTAFGQIAIAEAGLDLLATDGVEVKIRPRELVRYPPTSWDRVRILPRYGYRALRTEAFAKLFSLLARD